MNDSETFEILDKQHDSTLPRCCGNGPKYSSKIAVFLESVHNNLVRKI